MPSLQIRDLPDDIYEALSYRAAREHRSLTQQALAELTRVIRTEPSDSRKILLARIRRELAATGLPQDLLPENLVRRARTR